MGTMKSRKSDEGSRFPRSQNISFPKTRFFASLRMTDEGRLASRPYDQFPIIERYIVSFLDSPTTKTKSTFPQYKFRRHDYLSNLETTCSTT